MIDMASAWMSGVIVQSISSGNNSHMELLKLNPFFQVSNLDEAKAFYEKLGFRVDWIFGAPTPTHLKMDCGQVSLGFVRALADQDIEKGDIYIEVSDIRSLHAKYSDEVGDVSALMHTDYGMLDFSLHDPWGHHIVFGQSIDQQEQKDTLSPHTSDQAYVYITSQKSLITADLHPLMRYEEDEGTTMIITKEEADVHALAYEGLWAKVSLGLASDLSAVGLTAAFSAALLDIEMPCNVVAAYHHDHIFVPYERRQEACEVIKKVNLRS